MRHEVFAQLALADRGWCDLGLHCTHDDDHHRTRFQSRGRREPRRRRHLMPGASVIAVRVLSALHPGAIVIMYDGGGHRSQTVSALPAIINGIRAAGYEFVPVGEG
jgi:peptidoglycan/xylan/chitin deacetylase (PgdA/CDA1 family)